MLGRVVVLLAGGTYLAHSDQTSAQSKNVTAQAAAKKLRSQLYYLQQGPAQGGAKTASAASLKASVKTVLAQDVAWPTILGHIGVKLPPGVFLTSFNGTHTVNALAPGQTAAPTPAPAGTATGTSTGTGASTTGATGTTTTPIVDSNDLCSALTAPSGTVTLNGAAASLPAVAAFLDSLKKDTDLAVLWASTAKADANGAVDFTVTATLGSTARGNRLETFFKGAKCK